MLPMQPGGGPTVRRRILGVELRRIREAAGVSRREAGRAVGLSELKIARLERGQMAFERHRLGRLLALYGVAPDESEALLTLAGEANRPGWWMPYDRSMPAWFHTYVGLEEVARVIRTYEVQFIPGLLQTEDYARAVIQVGDHRASAKEIDERVALRMKRQRILDQPAPPRLWVIIDEAALRRPIGGREVMRAQLRHLLDAARHPHIALQVAPFSAGGHAGEAGAFTILRFPEPELPDVVYIEQLTGAMYLEDHDDVERYSATMDRLSVQSAAPRDSLDILSKILAEI